MSAPHSPALAAALEVHRLLDQAFAGIHMTPSRQDLKEEMRADLVARVADLVDDGVAPDEAARRAVAGLGDVRDLLDAVDPHDVLAADSPATDGRTASGTATASGAGTASGTDGARRAHARGSVEELLELHALNRVRPQPAFVVRAVLLGALGVAAIAVVALGGTVLDAPLALRLAATLVAAASIGVLVGDSLAQETTGNHPMPGVRAGAYGFGVGLALAGLGLAAQYWPGHEAGWPVTGVADLVASAALLTALGVTQTNRRKAWTRQWQAAQPMAADRFSEDPEAAARFGIYTAVLWLLAIATFVALSLTVGWAWSWIALVAAVAVMMIMLARMLFGPHQS